MARGCGPGAPGAAAAAPASRRARAPAMPAVAGAQPRPWRAQIRPRRSTRGLADSMASPSARRRSSVTSGSASRLSKAQRSRASRSAWLDRPSAMASPSLNHGKGAAAAPRCCASTAGKTTAENGLHSARARGSTRTRASGPSGGLKEEASSTASTHSMNSTRLTLPASCAQVGAVVPQVQGLAHLASGVVLVEPLAQAHKPPMPRHGGGSGRPTSPRPPANARCRRWSHTRCHSRHGLRGHALGLPGRQTGRIGTGPGTTAQGRLQRVHGRSSAW